MARQVTAVDASAGRRKAVRGGAAPGIRAGATRGAVILAVLTAVLGLLAQPSVAQARSAPAAGVPARSAGGTWTWPVDVPIQVGRPFAPPEVRYGAGHRGVDLQAWPGDRVLAAGAGRVSYAGLLAGRGVVVVVHGDLRTTYEPVTSSVTVGQSVSAGEPLGLLELGHAGCAAPACLHWGLRRGEDYLDPLGLVDRGPARLLPLGAPAPGRLGGRSTGLDARTPAAMSGGSSATRRQARPGGSSTAGEGAVLGATSGATTGRATRARGRRAGP